MKFVIEMRLLDPQRTSTYWYAGTATDGPSWVIDRRDAETLTCKNADALIERLHALVRTQGHYEISFHRQAVD